MASGLHKMGVSQGDVVLLLLPNSIYYPIIQLGVMYLGAVVTPLNPVSSVAEIRKQVNECGVSFAFTIPEHFKKLEPFNIPNIIVPENEKDLKYDCFSCFFNLIYSNFDFPQRPVIKQEDTAGILYSSGTTGVSKGVVLTHRNLIAMVELFARFQASSSSSKNVFLAALPMFHIFGLSLTTTGLLSLGSTVVVMKKFQIDEAIRVIDEYNVTHFDVVPPMLVTLTEKAKRVNGTTNEEGRVKGENSIEHVTYEEDAIDANNNDERLTKSSNASDKAFEVLKRKAKIQLFTTLSQASEPYPPHVISTNISISHCAKTGKLKEARHMFDEMPLKTVSSWNTMISGYSQWGNYTEALTLFFIMHRSCVEFNEISFSAVLSACARSESLFLGKQVHPLLLKSRHKRFGLVGSALLYFYVRCCGVREAEQVFEELCDENHSLWSLMLVGYVQRDMMGDAMKLFNKMPVRDVVAWTTLIYGFAKREDGGETALDLFQSMRRSSEVLPNEFTLDCVIRICARLKVLYLGKVVHGLCIKDGFDFDNFIGGALTEFYCVCDVVDDAKRVYDSIAAEASLNVANSLIGGLISIGMVKEAELIFNGLREKNPISYNLMIKGYAMTGEFENSKNCSRE
ncbi:hypothetical protein RYX36_026292 [Vicia faba]